MSNDGRIRLGGIGRCYLDRVICELICFAINPELQYREVHARLERRTARNGVKPFRFAVPGAPSSEPAAAQELSLPGSAEEWRGIFRAHGAHIYAKDGSLLRRRGDLIVYSTARMGRHEITLKPEDSGATELFTGRRFDGRSLVFDADRPQTCLFKVTAGKGTE